MGIPINQLRLQLLRTRLNTTMHAYNLDSLKLNLQLCRDAWTRACTPFPHDTCLKSFSLWIMWHVGMLSLYYDTCLDLTKGKSHDSVIYQILEIGFSAESKSLSQTSTIFCLSALKLTLRLF